MPWIETLPSLPVVDSNLYREHILPSEKAFAALLVQKTNEDILIEKMQMKKDLQKATARIDTISLMYEKLYEDNTTGKVTDEWFIQLCHKKEQDNCPTLKIRKL